MRRSKASVSPAAARSTRARSWWSTWAEWPANWTRARVPMLLAAVLIDLPRPVVETSRSRASSEGARAGPSRDGSSPSGAPQILPGRKSARGAREDVGGTGDLGRGDGDAASAVRARRREGSGKARQHALRHQLAAAGGSRQDHDDPGGPGVCQVAKVLGKAIHRPRPGQRVAHRFLVTSLQEPPGLGLILSYQDDPRPGRFGTSPGAGGLLLKQLGFGSELAGREPPAVPAVCQATGHPYDLVALGSQPDRRPALLDGRRQERPFNAGNVLPTLVDLAMEQRLDG